MRNLRNWIIGFVAFPVLMWAVALARPEYTSRQTWREKRR